MSKIVALEYYLPEMIVTNEELKNRFAEFDEAKVSSQIGVLGRHVAKENETALDMGLEASLKALKHYNKDKIDFLLFCTQSPDYFLPTGACILQHKLGLGNIGALDFNLGCSGYIYGLALASSLIKSTIASSVLLITSETYSKHIHPKDRTNIAIFGDAAAATIIVKDDNTEFFDLGSDGSGFDKLIVPNGGFRNKVINNPETRVYGTNNITDDNHLYMNGPDIFSFTIERVPMTIENLLKKSKLTITDIDYFIFHQANKYMLNYLKKKLKIPKDKFYNDLSDTGNVVSATIPIGLKKAINEGFVKSGDKVMLVGFGVGLSWGSTIIQM